MPGARDGVDLGFRFRQHACVGAGAVQVRLGVLKGAERESARHEHLAGRCHHVRVVDVQTRRLARRDGRRAATGRHGGPCLRHRPAVGHVPELYGVAVALCVLPVVQRRGRVLVHDLASEWADRPVAAEVRPRAVHHHEAGAVGRGGVAVRGGARAKAVAVGVTDCPVRLGPPRLIAVAKALPELHGLAVAPDAVLVVEAHPLAGPDRRVARGRTGHGGGVNGGLRLRHGGSEPRRHGRGDPP